MEPWLWLWLQAAVIVRVQGERFRLQRHECSYYGREEVKAKKSYRID
jgi:hypothetical protein